MFEPKMDFAERVRQECRLETLRCLADAPEYTATDGLLHTHLVSHGLSCSHAVLRTILAGLNESGLVVTQRAGGELGVTLATITESGLDVAAGRSIVPGIARPLPGR
ncbi:MAG: ArsR family transcriptional regulator [Candidatus Accumulibacter phosphatis]|uniref:ArsR family transcriptional regulator n=1 Tax=Candidatus Accumulibacter contiguus TaxID=2954381 RepID=A0ABX1T6I8_9PROT|nr:ArsR family transcriptional regulator [Candidatus Accumulibacter contiguus]NMQ05257.1 ArsR family transcriptional regulator [Candidatus Accumulibacter contiguus]